MAETYNPDVLSCLANLSNDEVFTPPAVVNQMLDLLPQELFKNPKTRFLDPAAKSGVFLREITKRLIKGLEKKIPDLKKRVDHILHEQVFGIATTELTSLVSRRSLYCSKYPNCKYSISKFDTVEGNIRFRNLKHTFVNGRCKWCGASASQFDRDESLESHAYEFIHTLNPQEIFNMKFDVIIGNPPYQMADGGNSASAMPIYQKFVEQAKNMNPRYLVMIIPARWYSGGRGLEEFRVAMLKDRHLMELVDYFDAEDCFPGIDLSGGVCYFLWDRAKEGECVVDSRRNQSSIKMKRPLLEPGLHVFIRFNEAVSICRKIFKQQELPFANIVSSMKPFGLRTYIRGSQKPFANAVKLYTNKNISSGVEYIPRSEILEGEALIDYSKLYISRAYGERGAFPYQVIGRPFYGEAKSCCTETYIVIGPTKNKREALNILSYMTTKFFRFLVLMVKNTQDAPKRVYQLVPMQDFSKPWTDDELYKKYKLTKEEIAFIESMIKPME